MKVHKNKRKKQKDYRKRLLWHKFPKDMEDKDEEEFRGLTNHIWGIQGDPLYPIKKRDRMFEKMVQKELARKKNTK